MMMTAMMKIVIMIHSETVEGRSRPSFVLPFSVAPLIASKRTVILLPEKIVNENVLLRRCDGEWGGQSQFVSNGCD